MTACYGKTTEIWEVKSSWQSGKWCKLQCRNFFCFPLSRIQILHEKRGGWFGVFGMSQEDKWIDKNDYTFIANRCEGFPKHRHNDIRGTLWQKSESVPLILNQTVTVWWRMKNRTLCDVYYEEPCVRVLDKYDRSIKQTLNWKRKKRARRNRLPSREFRGQSLPQG